MSNWGAGSENKIGKGLANCTGDVRTDPNSHNERSRRARRFNAMTPFAFYCRMVAAIREHGHDPRDWRRALDGVWHQLSDDEKELAPAIQFPTL
jgi:hypothetical protein